jgi:hypothetical protein
VGREGEAGVVEKRLEDEEEEEDGEGPEEAVGGERVREEAGPEENCTGGSEIFITIPRISCKSGRLDGRRDFWTF